MLARLRTHPVIGTIIMLIVLVAVVLLIATVVLALSNTGTVLHRP